MDLTSISANAEFIKGDWKVEGEQLTAVDTQTGIEWLSLEVTIGQSYSYVNYVLTSSYSGWRMPTSSEVIEVMDNVMGWNNPAEDVLAYSDGQHQEGISNFRYVFGTLYDVRVYGEIFGIHRTDLTSPIYYEDRNRFSMTGVLDRYDSSETDTIYQGYGFTLLLMVELHSLVLTTSTLTLQLSVTYLFLGELNIVKFTIHWKTKK